MNRTQMLKKTEKILEDRQGTYGNASDNYSRVAGLWNAYLEEENMIGAEDVAIMMALFKIGRICATCYQSEDSWVDACGYLALGAEIAGESDGEEMDGCLCERCCEEETDDCLCEKCCEGETAGKPEWEDHLEEVPDGFEEADTRYEYNGKAGQQDYEFRCIRVKET